MKRSYINKNNFYVDTLSIIVICSPYIIANKTVKSSL